MTYIHCEGGANGDCNYNCGPCPELVQLLSGLGIPCHFIFPLNPPSWLDKDLYQLGINFYQKNTLGIIASNGEALVMGLALPSFYKPLAFSGVTSNKRRAAMVRYMDTARHVFGSWYTSKPWEEGSRAARSFKTVNSMHKHVADMVTSAGDSFEDKVHLVFTDSGVDDEQAVIMKEELGRIKQSYQLSSEYSAYINSGNYFSQFDMTLVQAAFFAAVLIYPNHYGSKFATKQELEGFVHVWRVFGYYLGLSEENNAAQFDIERTVVVGKEVIELILKPCMLNVSDQSIILAQKIFSNPQNYFVWVYRNYRMVGFNLDKLWKSFNWKQRCLYYWRSIFLDFIYPLPLVRHFMNYCVRWLLTKVSSEVKSRSY